jgi:hypothetical protein
MELSTRGHENQLRPSLHKVLVTFIKRHTTTVSTRDHENLFFSSPLMYNCVHNFMQEYLNIILHNLRKLYEL